MLVHRSEGSAGFLWCTRSTDYVYTRIRGIPRSMPIGGSALPKRRAALKLPCFPNGGAKPPRVD